MSHNKLISMIYLAIASDIVVSRMVDHETVVLEVVTYKTAVLETAVCKVWIVVSDRCCLDTASEMVVGT